MHGEVAGPIWLKPVCIVDHKHALPHRSLSADDMCSGWVSLLKSHLEHTPKAAAGRASPHDAHCLETTSTVTSRFCCGHLLLHCLQFQDRPSLEWLVRVNRAAGSVSWQLTAPPGTSSTIPSCHRAARGSTWKNAAAAAPGSPCGAAAHSTAHSRSSSRSGTSEGTR